MKKFSIVIEETIAQEFEVEAENKEYAIKIAKEKYYNGEFVLEPGEVTLKQLAVAIPNEEIAEWIEF